jgi:hypothetical protein
MSARSDSLEAWISLTFIVAYVNNNLDSWPQGSIKRGVYMLLTSDRAAKRMPLVSIVMLSTQPHQPTVQVSRSNERPEHPLV